MKDQRTCILSDTILPMVGNISSEYDLAYIEELEIGDTVNNYMYSTNTISPAVILGMSRSKVIDSKCKWYKIHYLKDLVPVSTIVSEDTEILMPDGSLCNVKDIDKKIGIIFDHATGARYEYPIFSKKISKWKILWDNLKEFSRILRKKKKEEFKDVYKDIKHFRDMKSNRYVYDIGIRPEYGFMSTIDTVGFIILSNGLAIKAPYYVNYK